MDHELVITDQIFREHFEGERDLVTYSPYRVGDRVVRCGACRSVVKAGFVQSACPLCGRAPFTPVPVFREPTRLPALTSRRKPGSFLPLLLLFSPLALLPFSGSGADFFLSRLACDWTLGTCLLLAGGISLLSALILSRIPRLRRLWRQSGGGWLLLLLPALCPYLLLAALLFLSWFIPILFQIIGILLIILILICIFA